MLKASRYIFAANAELINFQKREVGPRPNSPECHRDVWGLYSTTFEFFAANTKRVQKTIKDERKYSVSNWKSYEPAVFLGTIAGV